MGWCHCRWIRNDPLCPSRTWRGNILKLLMDVPNLFLAAWFTSSHFVSHLLGQNNTSCGMAGWEGSILAIASCHCTVWGKLVLLSCVTLHKLYTSSIYRKAAGNKHWRCVNLSRPLWHQVFQQPLPKARGHVHKRFVNGGSSSASRVLTWWYASCLLFIFMDLRISPHISSWSTTPQTHSFKML